MCAVGVVVSVCRKLWHEEEGKPKAHLPYEIYDAHHQRVGGLVDPNQQAVVHDSELGEEGCVTPETLL